MDLVLAVTPTRRLEIDRLTPIYLKLAARQAQIG